MDWSSDNRWQRQQADQTGTCRLEDELVTPGSAQRRIIVVVDIAEFTRPDRTVAHQLALQSGLYDVLRSAFSDIGVDVDTWVIEDRGDGALILIPKDFPKSELVDVLPDRLVAELRRYNATKVDAAKIKLRVAVHEGEIRKNEHGWMGGQVALAFRMLDEPEAKLALQRSDGVVALIASDSFYSETILRRPGTSPEAYRRIDVQVKNFTGQAWLRLVGTGEGPGRFRWQDPSVDEVTIHTSGDDGTSVRDAVVHLLESAGYVIVDRQNPELGSWFQRMFVRPLDPDAAKVSAAEIACAVTNEVKSAMVGSVIQAGEVLVTSHPQSTREERLVDSAARLLEAIRDHEEVLVYLPPLLLVKIGPRVLSWEPTDEERAIITANPHLLHSPGELLALFASTTRQNGASGGT
ncbi:hypothetical protein [Lentzea flaviverrucosa]|uniref:hypothetical protein n=1 Tax=Lentzea flaviverrucosa TaxID=200379 RepID=UPI0014771217|nr:hypothetical protein [Lentzea flaviverrucosa]